MLDVFPTAEQKSSHQHFRMQLVCVLTILLNFIELPNLVVTTQTLNYLHIGLIDFYKHYMYKLQQFSQMKTRP